MHGEWEGRATRRGIKAHECRQTHHNLEAQASLEAHANLQDPPDLETPHRQAMNASPRLMTRKEWVRLGALVGLFLAIDLLPIGSPQVQAAGGQGLRLTRWYAPGT